MVLAGLAGLLLLRGAAQADHPNLYISTPERNDLIARIATEPWAKSAFEKLRADVDPYVERTQKDPQFVVSRLAMYWKDGERYTQCYVKKENWDRGEGNAPVPTVRLPGMRVWNDYVNVPLADRKPYNETGDMLATSRKDPKAPAVVVPYKESGHLIRGNNVEILTLAEESAFLYWLTRDEKYARFSADIYWAWLLGTYYMNPVLDPARSSGGPGGWEPGGILGFYDYEQIHDDLMMHAAPIYDFLLPYLEAHPHPHLQVIGADVKQASAAVFKKFIDIGLVRGGNKGNWNVNGWNVMMRGVLVLEPDDFYVDKKGRQYYLKFYTTTTTAYHDALPDVLKQYDPVTGLWPEAPGYAFGVGNALLDMAIPIQRAGVDTIADNPMLAKAAMAIFPWMDARGNLVVFGDSRGGPANFAGMERLLTYYRSVNDQAHASVIASAILKGIASGAYDRASTDWVGLCLNQPLGGASDALPAPTAAYSPVHRHLVMRNLNDEDNGMMFTLYGGYPREKHLCPNGLAMQLYGKGWALGPDAAAYESYWSSDYGYHQTATGVNTILPGYTAGPIQVEAMEPPVAPDQFTASDPLSPSVQLADVSAAEKRRMVAVVRTSPTTGYYVDIFRSKQDDNDYLYHNLGTHLDLSETQGSPLDLQPIDAIPHPPAKAYSFFQKIRHATFQGTLQGDWVIETTQPAIHMKMWMPAAHQREVYQVDAPPTTLLPAVTPGQASLTPQPTPTVLIRQSHRSGWDDPFVAVFEPFNAGAQSVQKVDSSSANGVVRVEIQSKLSTGNVTDVLLHSDSAQEKSIDADVQLAGSFATWRTIGGTTQEMLLVQGTHLRAGSLDIASAGDKPVSARLYRDGDAWKYSARQDVVITLPKQKPVRCPAARDAVVPGAH